MVYYRITVYKDFISLVPWWEISGKYSAPGLCEVGITSSILIGCVLHNLRKSKLLGSQAFIRQYQAAAMSVNKGELVSGFGKICFRGKRIISIFLLHRNDHLLAGLQRKKNNDTCYSFSVPLHPATSKSKCSANWATSIGIWLIMLCRECGTFRASPSCLWPAQRQCSQRQTALIVRAWVLLHSQIFFLSRPLLLLPLPLPPLMALSKRAMRSTPLSKRASRHIYAHPRVEKFWWNGTRLWLV